MSKVWSGSVWQWLMLALFVNSATVWTQQLDGQQPLQPGAKTVTTLPATDVTAAAIQAFIEKLPKNASSDLPIRVVDVGGYRVGVFGVFRPKASNQEAVLHETKVSEIYYMLEGGGTLVTGGVLVDERRTPGNITVRGSRIDGGVTRHVGKGDVVIIPGAVPHWWSALDGELSYLIIRPDPEGKQTLK